MTSKMQSTSPESTRKLGRAIGAKLEGGEVIELVGDLGTGKTELVRGIAEGMESKDIVQSPTFTIERIYKGKGQHQLHHFDFYRLEEGGVVGDELTDAMKDTKSSVAIEWSGVIQDILPEDRLRIELSRLSEDTRELKVTAGSSHQRLLVDVKL